MTVIPLVTFDGVNGGTILNIGKGGGVVQRKHLGLKQSLQIPKRRHQFWHRGIDLTQAAGLLRNMECGIEGFSRNGIQLGILFAKTLQSGDHTGEIEPIQKLWLESLCEMRSGIGAV